MTARRPAPGPSWRARLSRVVAGALLTLLVAHPAMADPPGPTQWRSEVDEAALPGGIDAAVLGGDSFLRVDAGPGTEVLVPGYDGREQFLRIDGDGSVWVNRRSASWWQNEDRYAATPVPPGVGADVPPEWVLVATEGSWAWHDHRIHWMSPETLPGDIDADLAVQQAAGTWEVPVVVDGAQQAITGSLTWLPQASPWTSVVAAAALLAVGLAVGRAGRGRAIALVLGVAVAATVAVSLPRIVGLAPGVTSEVLPLVLAAAAGLVGGAGLALRGRPLGLVLAGLAGVPLVVWGVVALPATTAPIVPPTSVPSALVRAAVGIALGGGLGLVGLGLWEAFTRPLDLGDPPGQPARG